MKDICKEKWPLFVLARLEWILDQAKFVSLLSPGSLSVIDFFDRD